MKKEITGYRYRPPKNDTEVIERFKRYSKEMPIEIMIKTYNHERLNKQSVDDAYIKALEVGLSA